MPSKTEGLDRQRIDKWLWHARVVRTRTAAAALVDAGHVRINGARADGASRPVRLGDVITIALDRRVRVLKVTAHAERRGSAEAGRILYQELTEERAASPGPPVAARPPGSGRPTKHDRRKIARLLGRDEFE